MSLESFENKPHNNPESELHLNRRVLWLTKDPEIVRRQIEGEDIPFIPKEDLKPDISTDEIIPSRWVFYFDEETLGEHCMTGYMGGGIINPGDIKRGQFDLVIGGSSFGMGSSREHAPMSFRGAGVKVVAGNTVGGIFLQNSNNINLPVITNVSQLEQLLTNNKIDKNELTKDYDVISKDIVKFGGLLPYLEAIGEQKVTVPDIDTLKRPMTMVEKIIAGHWINSDGSQGRVAVKPGDTGFIRSDFRFGYEIMSGITIDKLTEFFGEDYQILDPDSIALFADHTAILETQNAEQQHQVVKLIRMQAEFARKNNIKLYNPGTGICHNVVSENHALPGQVILGTDSHTCSNGVVGAFADGIGSTEMAGAFISNETRISVPATWKFNFTGELPDNVMAKDIMLHLLTFGQIKKGEAKDKVFEYTGPGLKGLSFDELFVLPNMVAEAGGLTGIIEPTSSVLDRLKSARNLTSDEISKLVLRSDPDAEFEEVYNINLSELVPMVAIPGSPRGGMPLKDVERQQTDAVYIGSCTGGKLEDLIAVANVLDGRRVNIPTYIQASTLQIRQEAISRGLFNIFDRAGAKIIDPGCGDCCNLGFGVVERGGTIVSDTNRNFPNRMGENVNVYLTNPHFAAIAALKGHLSTKP